MDTTTDAAAARPTTVAFVNLFDATTVGRTVHLTPDQERRLRNVLAALRDYGFILEASFEPALPGCGFADVAAHLRSTIGSLIADLALAAAERSVPATDPAPAAVMRCGRSSRRAVVGTCCSPRRGCGASTCWSRRCASRTTTTRRRRRPCTPGSGAGPTPRAKAGG